MAVNPLPILGPPQALGGINPVFNVADGMEAWGGGTLFYIPAANNTNGVAPFDCIEEGANPGEYQVVPSGGITANKFAGVCQDLYNQYKQSVGNPSLTGSDYNGRIIPAGVACYVTLVNANTVAQFVALEDLGDATPLVIGNYVGVLGTNVDSNGFSTFKLARTTDNATFNTQRPFQILSLAQQSATPAAGTRGTYVVRQVYSKAMGLNI